MLSIDKTHALSDRKMQKTARFVILLYFLPITHPSKLLNWRFGVSRWSLCDERNFGRDFNNCRRVFTFVNIGSNRPSPPPRPLKIMIRFTPLKNKTSKTGKNIGTDIADGTILRCKTAARSPLIRSYPRFFLRYTTKATRGRANERRRLQRLCAICYISALIKGIESFGSSIERPVARPHGMLIPDVPSPTRSLSERSGERRPIIT